MNITFASQKLVYLHFKEQNAYIITSPTSGEVKTKTMITIRFICTLIIFFNCIDSVSQISEIYGYVFDNSIDRNPVANAGVFLMDEGGIVQESDINGRFSFQGEFFLNKKYKIYVVAEGFDRTDIKYKRLVVQNGSLADMGAIILKPQSEHYLTITVKEQGSENKFDAKSEIKVDEKIYASDSSGEIKVPIYDIEKINGEKAISISVIKQGCKNYGPETIYYSYKNTSNRINIELEPITFNNNINTAKEFLSINDTRQSSGFQNTILNKRMESLQPVSSKVCTPGIVAMGLIGIAGVISKCGRVGFNPSGLRLGRLNNKSKKRLPFDKRTNSKPVFLDTKKRFWFPLNVKARLALAPIAKLLKQP